MPSNQSTVQWISAWTGAHSGLPNSGLGGGFVVDRVGSVGGRLLHELMHITDINAHTIARLMID